MSRLTRRLELLEQRHRADHRCDTCRDWWDCRVVHSDPEMAALAAHWSREWELPQPPERCPDCGWEPLTIRVEYIESGWGSTEARLEGQREGTWRPRTA